MLKHSHYMIAKGRLIIFFGVAIALLHWFIEGLVHFYVFESGNLAEGLLPSNKHELWTRSIVFCIIIGFSIFTQMIVNALYETSKQFQALFDEAPDAIFLADSESGLITDANPAASKLLLLPHHEIVGLHQSKLHPPVKRDDSTKIFMAQVEESKKGKEAKPVEEIILRSDGLEVPVEIMAKTVNLGSNTILQGIYRDISEHVRIEETMRKSEDRFRTIFHNISDGIILADAQSKKFYLGNKSICKMLDYDQEELKKIGVSDIHPEQNLPYVSEQFEKMAKGKLRIAKEIPVKRKDGSIFYADINSFFIELEAKPYLVGVFRDVSERKESEDKLKKSEEKFRLAMEVTNDALWDWNMVTGETYRNPRHATMLGYEPHEISTSQDEWIEHIHPDDKRLLLELVDEHLSGRRESFEVEYRLKTKSGDYVWVLGRGKIVAYNDKGSPLRMIGTNMDISERKKAQEALVESEQRYRSLVEDTPVLLCNFLTDGTITFVNTAYCKHFGQTKEELVGKNFKYLIPEEDRETVLNNILSLTPNSGSMTHEHKVIAKGDQIKWQRWTNRALMSKAVQFLFNPLARILLNKSK